MWVDSAEQPDRRVSRVAGSKACFSRGLRLTVVGVWLGVILVVAVKEVVNPVVCFGENTPFKHSRVFAVVKPILL